jgi:hypothetical protein
MSPLWFITGAALVAALVAFSQARRTARRLEQLTQMYWELKFQHGELRVQLRQLTGASAAPGTGESAAQAAPPSPAPPTEHFVPLSAVKR